MLKPISIFLLMSLGFAVSTNCQGFLHADGKSLVDARGKEVLLRGIGLGGWMLQEPYMLQLSGTVANQSDLRSKITALVGEEKTQSFYKLWLQNHGTRADIDSLAAWGFNSVRLPMHYNLFTLPVEKEPVKGNDTWLKEGFSLVDSLLAWCTANKIYLILDLHAAPGGQGKDVPIADYDSTRPSLWESDENRKKTIALWEQIAKRYAQEPWLGGYDLLNETNWGFTSAADKNGCAEKNNQPLRQLLIDITQAIRKFDRNHLVIIEGNCWGNNYDGVFPLWDNNLAISFHKYWNYNDQNSVQKFVDIRNRYNVPIWMGESGENSNVWYRNAIELLEKNNIGWAWWPLKKIGINNPLQIKSNPDYEKIVRYWKGEAPKPTRETALKGLMQLADDAHIRNNIIQRDVIDAMFRQVSQNKQLPYRQHILKDTVTILAVDYDLGRNGMAYFDNDTANYRVSTGSNTVWNKGRRYRNDGVDIFSFDNNTADSFAVGWMEKNEWLSYTIHVLQGGRYDILLKHACKDNDNVLQVSVNNSAVSPVKLNAPTDQKWNSVTIKDVFLSEGENIIKLELLQGNCDLFSFHFTRKK